MRFRGACLGCPFMVIENAVPHLRVSPLLDSHAHDGRYGLPGHDLLFSATPALRLRCAVDGKRTRQGGGCRIKVGDARLVEALKRTAEATGSRPDAGENAEE
jgi:hypothetical protein